MDRERSRLKVISVGYQTKTVVAYIHSFNENFNLKRDNVPPDVFSLIRRGEREFWIVYVMTPQGMIITNWQSVDDDDLAITGDWSHSGHIWSS